jgi:tetratricopeptide (TPR) repeat protein
MTNANERPQAEFSARQALRLEAGSGEAWRVLGTVQLQAEQIADASLSAKRALELQTHDRATWELSRDVLARQQRPLDAFDSYVRAISAELGRDLDSFRTRAGLLAKCFGVLNTDSDRRAALNRQLEEWLAVGRSLPVGELGIALNVYLELTDACLPYLLGPEAAKVWTDYAEGLGRLLPVDPWTRQERRGGCLAATPHAQCRPRS